MNIYTVRRLVFSLLAAWYLLWGFWIAYWANNQSIILHQLSIDWRTEWFDIELLQELSEEEYITISGLKSSDVIVEWPLQDWVYRIHDWDHWEWALTCTTIPNAWLNITDTKGWSVSIFLTWTLVAEYNRSEEDAQNIDNSDRTFQRESWWVLHTLDESECGEWISTIQDDETETDTENEDQEQLDQWTITIHEIHPQNDLFWEYSELICNGCIGTYTLAWFWTWTSTHELTFTESYSWIVLLTWMHSSIESNPDQTFQFSLSLTDWWELLSVYGQNGQVLDSVDYEWGLDEYLSRYEWDGIEFSSPWLRTEYWNLLQKPILDDEDTEDEPSSSSQPKECEYVSSINKRQQLYITLAEAIESKWHSVRPWWRIYRARQDEHQVTEYKTQQQCEKGDQPDTSKTNSSFSQTQPVVKDSPKQQSILETQPFDWSITLVSVLPDPEWTDAGHEQILLQSSVGRDAVEEITITVNDTPKVYERNSDHRSVDWDTLLIQWSLRLRNSDACVTVSIDEISSNELCYTKTSPWVHIWFDPVQSESNTETSSQTSNILSDTLLKTHQRYQETVALIRSENEELNYELAQLDSLQSMSDDLFYLRKEHVQTSHPGLYYDWALERSYTVYRDLQESRYNLLSSNQLPVETFESYIALQTWSLPLWAISLPSLLDDYLL